VKYPTISRYHIPPGGVEVDINVIDAFNNHFDAVFIAGNLGMEVSTREDTKESHVRSVAVWCVALREDKEVRKDRTHREKLAALVAYQELLDRQSN